MSHSRAKEEEPSDTRFWCADALGQLHPPAPGGDQGMGHCEGEHAARGQGKQLKGRKIKSIFCVFNETFLIR